MKYTRIFKSLLIVTITTLFILSSFPTEKLYSNSVSQGLKEYTLNPSDFEMGSVEFTNSEDKEVTVILSVLSYDPETETFLDTKPFVGVGKTEYKVGAKQSIHIDYAISIPAKQPIGTYFNVITIEPEQEEVEATGGINIGIKNGFGVLFAIHVETSDSNIDKIFIESSDTQLIIEKRGFPLLSPMRIKYIYKNESNFVFKPQGEIRILDSNDNQIVERVTINPEGKSVYPGKSLEVEKDINIWDDLNKVFQPRVVTARTYNGFTENYLTNEVKVSLKEPIIAIAVISTILLLLIIGTTIKTVQKRKKNTKSQESVE